MSTVAYELREEFKGTVLQRETEDDPGTEVPKFTGGLVGAGDTELELGKALQEGNGRIVIDETADPLLAAVLDDVGALKRVSTEDVDEPTIGYADWPGQRLRDEAGRRGIAGAAGAKVDDLRDALAADDARIQAGHPQPEDYSVHALIAPAPDETPEA